jgi:hypothetical protein
MNTAVLYTSTYGTDSSGWRPRPEVQSATCLLRTLNKPITNHAGPAGSYSTEAVTTLRSIQQLRPGADDGVTIVFQHK